MIAYTELEQSTYLVWIDFGSEGWQPRTCLTWSDVLSEIRHSTDPWIITKPVTITEPFEKVNNLR